MKMHLVTAGPWVAIISGALGAPAQAIAQAATPEHDSGSAPWLLALAIGAALGLVAYRRRP